MIRNIRYFLLCKNCAKAGINLNYAKKEIYIEIYIINLLNILIKCIFLYLNKAIFREIVVITRCILDRRITKYNTSVRNHTLLQEREHYDVLRHY